MFQIIPAVDVLAGKVVRLLHGDYDQVTHYGDDPVARCLDWMQQGAPLVHVVDLAGARSGRPDRELWQHLGAAGVRFEVGGGIRTRLDAEEAIAAGAGYAVMGTAAVWQPDILGALAHTGRVMAAVDVRNGMAQGQGWLDEGRPFSDVLDGLASAGVRRVLVTGIAVDGTMAGPESDLLLEAVAHRSFEVIASGGVGALTDIESVITLGCDGVVIGKALYEGRFTLAQALEVVA